MAGAAEGFSAQEHGSRLSRTVELGRDVGAHPSRALCGSAREPSAARPAPTAAIIDSQSAKGALKGGALLDPSGYDAGKKVKGRKRHILVDTLGLLLSVAVHSADIQDRDGAALVLDKRTRRSFPFIERIFADGGYNAKKTADAVAATGTWVIEIVKRSDAHRFVVMPKRWIVERTLAWDQPQPTPGARLRALRHNRRGLHPPRHDPHHAQATCRKSLKMIQFFPDRLLAPQIRPQATSTTQLSVPKALCSLKRVWFRNHRGK